MGRDMLRSGSGDGLRQAFYLSTALAIVLGFGSGIAPAQAQSVIAAGDVAPFPSPNPRPNWNVGSFLYIGANGTGTLTIADGGTVSNTAGYIAYSPNAAGSSVEVTGAGSTWTNSGAMSVGRLGTGTLTIADGGTVENSDGYIGFSPNAAGSSVEVTGAGSTWMNSGDLYVGSDGTGTLTIADGGTVSNSNGFIGAFTNAAGSSVEVTGAGSTWANSGELYIGREGAGALTIADGGTVSNTSGYIGFSSSAAGSSVEVTGAGSTWTNFGFLIVGREGMGTLTIADGGTVSNTDGVIGYSLSAAASSVEVTGAGSTWTNSRTLYVGSDGTGTLTIADGGTVSNTDSSIGYFPYAAGSGVEVTGAGSTWTNSGFLNVGSEGAGTLTIADGGTVENSDGYIGVFTNAAGSSVEVTGAGSTWMNSGDLYVGSNGTGTLTIADGGTVSNTDGSIGYSLSAADSSVGVTGADSTWTNSSFLYVGYGGTGMLTIADGGTVSNTDGFIGHDTGAAGSSVEVTGAGSTWTNSGTLSVGYDGTGMLTIADGGTVSNTDGVIGYHSTAAGSSVEVTGAGSAWTNSGFLYVGFEGMGMLTIADGGTVSNTGGIIGYYGTAVGSSSVEVTGAGSTWTNSGFLYVGSDGKLTIADGGTVSVGDGAGGQGTVRLRDFAGGTINIGTASGVAHAAAGTLDAATIAFGIGAGTLNFNHIGETVFTAELDSNGAGDHAVNHLAGNTTLTGDSSGFTGATTVSGGTLLVGDAAGNGRLGGIVTVGTGGTLGGSGTLTGAVTIDGTLSAGNSPGMLTFADDLTLNAGSTSVFELNSPGIVGGVGAAGNDLVVVDGALTLGGTLEAHVAAAGYYRLFDYNGALSGAFSDGEVIGTGGFVPVDPNAPDIRYDIPGQVNLSVLGAGQTMQFWDGGHTTGNGVVEGGDGVWQGFGTNWTDSDGTVHMGWGGSVGVFAGTGGIVTIQGAQSFDTLQFSTDGYRIEGDSLAIRFGGGGTFNIDTGVSATVASVVEGGADSLLRKAGAGTLVLTGDNTYSGGTHLLSGVLSVSADSNLGAASGGLTFDGGVLEVTGTDYSATARDIVIDAGGGGFDIVDAANMFTLAGNITGGGSLFKQGDGTLVLTDANSYGDTRVQAGTLIGDTASIQGVIYNGGTVVFDQAGAASFAGDIGGLDGADGQMVKRGGGALTLVGTSVLDWSIEDGALVSATDRFGGDLDIASGAGFVFDQPNDGSYSSILSGAGELSIIGGGTITLTGDNSGFTGLSTVTGSTLIVSDTLGGSALIGSGGRLAGTGTIGLGVGSLVTIADGGTLAPGNSIGTLTVDGDLVVGAGSRFEVEVTPGGADGDQVNVTGTATIDGGTVAHIGMTGAYDPTATYTILSAAGGLKTGSAFDEVTSDFAFLDATLGYGANDITLTLTRNDIDFVDVGVTRNQRATAGELESLGFGNDLYDAVVQLDEPTALAAFDQLSGEIHGSVLTGLVEDSRHLRNAANDRIRAAFGDVGASATPVLAYGPEGPVLAPADGSHLGMSAWGTAYGSWGSTDSDGNAALIDRSTGGVLMGADALVTDQVRLGLLAGYSRSSVNLDARASSADIDSYHLGLYGGAQWDAPNGMLSLRGGLAYSWHDIGTSRSVGFVGFADSLTADYDASTLQAFGELGYGIETKVARVEPFVNLAHVDVGTDGFNESGGAAALIGFSGSDGVTFTTLGVRAKTAIGLGQANARLNGMVGWRHAFGDTTPTSTHAFAGSDAFTIAGSPIGHDALVLDAGLDLDLTRDATLGLSWQGQYADGDQDHGFRADLSIRF